MYRSKSVCYFYIKLLNFSVFLLLLSGTCQHFDGQLEIQYRDGKTNITFVIMQQLAVFVQPGS
jgi:hypothetical protein